MKATAIQMGKVYSITFGKNTTNVKVVGFNNKTGSWNCETELGKTIPIKDSKRFLKEVKPKEPKPKKEKTMDEPPQDSPPNSDMSDFARELTDDNVVENDFENETGDDIDNSFEDEKESEEYVEQSEAEQTDDENLQALAKAARETSLRATITKRAYEYGFCSQSVANEAFADAHAARDAFYKAGGKRPASKSGRSNGAMSGIDAAYQVLKEEGRPMRAKEITELALSRNYCILHGLTPDATISASIEIEIKRKGEQSRFVKVDKGLFAIR
ncbi:MAG: hypothetical protein LBT05_14950 [Planctomycetaceae bacterium]|jgi:hypothetical protein|nr:hypothetical protein [Planctomycetaceae bacterium]